MGGLLAGLYGAVLLVATGGGAPMHLTANEHPWGNFQPNSWCIVQTVTISSIDGRAVQSTQTVRTTLLSIDESGITLHRAETLNLGGIPVEKRPQVVRYDFFQEPVQENVRIREGPPSKLVIDRRVVPCAVRIYEQQTSGGHLTTTVWYTPHVFPHVLRVERILRASPGGENGEGGQIIRQSVTQVQETSALKALRGNRRNRTYSLQTIERVGNITRITDARCSWDVPGGLLESTTREFDAQNREIRRTVSRMTNYFSVELLPSPPQRRTWMPIEAAN
jgi:hypothetical protein